MLFLERNLTLAFLITISLIIVSLSYGGVHFVELPDNITDEMILNQTQS